MKKVLALVVAAAMGLSSVAFAADTTAAPAPAAAPAATTAAPAAALQQNIWQHGSRFTTDQLIKNATGETLNPAYFRKHLESRYL